MLRGKRATRTLLLAVVVGVAAGVISALTHTPAPAGDGFLVFGGILIGAGAML